MNVHIVDGPPSIGVTRVLASLRGLDEMENLSAGVHTNFIERSLFRDVGSLTRERIERALGEFFGIIQSAKGQSHFLIDGSPVSYIAIRRFYGLSCDDTIPLMVRYFLENSAHKVSVTLALPGKTFQPPRNMRVFDPNAILPYSYTLLDTYREFGFHPEVAHIGEINQANFRDNAL